jgi:hypothetical protein
MIQLAGLIFAVGFYSLSSKVIDTQLTFFSDEAWFDLQEYINTNNYRCWSLYNAHLTCEVLLHPEKVGVRCAVSVRMMVGPVFFNETVTCEGYVEVILGQFFPELPEE